MSDWVPMAAIALVGLFIGRYVVAHWAVYPRHVIAFVALAGTAFFVTLGIARLDEGTSLDAAGELAVWWLFCATFAIGLLAQERAP